MKLWHQFIENVRLRRFCVLLFLIIILYLVRGMMTIILLTFIFTFLVTKSVNWIHAHVKIPKPLLVVIIYAVIVAAIVTVSTIYLPRIVDQGIDTTKSLINFYQDPNNFVMHSKIGQMLVDWFYQSNMPSLMKSGVTPLVNSIARVGSMGVALFMSLILSFFFTLESKQMAEFSKKFLDSTFGWFFQDVYHFAKIFVRTFGVVLEAQLLIAVSNTILTTIVMFFLHMPQLALLAVMVFLLSLIPVAGVIISLIPLSLIGYSVGGVSTVITLIITIAVVHVFESYFLNPKFMSSKTELPIFYTFVVLLAGEELFGSWGLIVSVPIFTFLLDVMKVQKVR